MTVYILVYWEVGDHYRILGVYDDEDDAKAEQQKRGGQNPEPLAVFEIHECEVTLSDPYGWTMGSDL